MGSDVCVVGGGPAGMMLAVLLLRQGLSVTVLEKHADFLRDFRGDTIHASTLNLMDELGWGDEFLRLPHQKARRLYTRAMGFFDRRSGVAAGRSAQRAVGAGSSSTARTLRASCAGANGLASSAWSLIALSAPPRSG